VEEEQMAKKHMKKCLTFLAIKKMELDAGGSRLQS
jgi:hypothetical protein